MELGDIVLLDFPFSDAQGTKARPALLLAMLPGKHDDVLVCMISSQTDQAVYGFDEVILSEEEDFSSTGLKRSSVVRIGRLHVADRSMLLGSIGAMPVARLERIRARLVAWLAPAGAKQSESGEEDIVGDEAKDESSQRGE